MSERILRQLRGVYSGSASDVSSPRMMLERVRDDLDTMGLEEIFSRHPEFWPTDRDVRVKDGRIEEEVICPMLGRIIDQVVEERPVVGSGKSKVRLGMTTEACDLSPDHASLFKKLYRRQSSGRRMKVVFLG